ncbi:MAG TPA: tetratricopeptide repeat protein [Chthoniobacterales bacterium]|nr:tetratricopeptide repeat protein [Chthoniobacterales bacterium]
MQFYDDWAKQILLGHLTDHQAFYGLPLYPVLLSVLYRIFGYSPFIPGLFQACFDAGTAALIYKITGCLLNRGRDGMRKPATVTGIVAAAGWCFFVPAQAYSAVLMPTAAATFVFWLLVWQIIRTEAAPSPLRCSAYGLLLGFAATGVAAILFLLPLFIAAIIIRQARMAARIQAVALLLVGVIVGTAPCWIHNCLVARDPVFLSAHGGINFWLGNNPEATGYPRFPGLHAGQGQMLRDSIDQAEGAAGRSLKRSEVSRYWSAKARDYIAANPGPWLKLLARKAANFWNAFEYDDLGVIVNLRQHRILFPGLHFGLIAALGLAGTIFSWRTFPASRWIAAAVALQLAAILPVFVTERYRLPVVPGLLVFAALGLQRLWTNLVNSNYTKAAPQLGIAALATLLVAIPRHDPSLWALEAYNAGRFALEINNLTAAEHHLQRAHALVPDNAETNFALGNLRLAQGNSAVARDYYDAVLKIDPNHKGTLNNLGVLALNGNDSAHAIDFFRHALRLDPRNPKTHFLLARALDLAGNRDEARIEAARAVELDSSQPEYVALQERLNEK